MRENHSVILVKNIQMENQRQRKITSKIAFPLSKDSMYKI